MKKAALYLTILTGSLWAQPLGLSIGLGGWSPEISGNTGNKNSPSYDINNDYGISQRSKSNYIWVDYKMPIIFLPNIKVESTSFKMKGKSKKTLKFNDKLTTTGAQTEFTLKQNDLILYYTTQVIPYINLNFGLDFKKFTGDMRVTQGSTEKQNNNYTAPLVYLGTKINIPETKLSFSSEVKFNSEGKSEIGDYNIKVSYALYNSKLTKLGFELGYKEEEIKLDSNDTYKADLTIKGPFFGLFASF